MFSLICVIGAEKERGSTETRTQGPCRKTVPKPFQKDDDDDDDDDDDNDNILNGDDDDDDDILTF